jgi:hypothetical protein
MFRRAAEFLNVFQYFTLLRYSKPTGQNIYHYQVNPILSIFTKSINKYLYYTTFSLFFVTLKIILIL